MATDAEVNAIRTTEDDVALRLGADPRRTASSGSCDVGSAIVRVTRTDSFRKCTADRLESLGREKEGREHPVYRSTGID